MQFVCVILFLAFGLRADTTHDTDICQAVFDKVEKINITSTANAIRVSWKPHKYAQRCKIHYVITANKEIPYYRYVNSTVHWIKNLHSCTAYTVSVTPSNFLLDEYEPNRSSRNVYNVTTLPGPVENVKVDFNNVSWTPPKNSECIGAYNITYKTNTITVNTTYLEPNMSLFCEPIKIVAIAKTRIEGKPVEALVPGPVQNLICKNVTANSVSAIWDSPENGTCTDQYEVALIGGKNDPIRTSDTIYTFFNLASCATVDITVRAVSNDTTGPPTSYTISTLPPEEPGPVQNLICGNATADSVSATWEPPENGTCIELYEVALIGSNNSTRTNDTNYTFFGLTSCTVFNISVRAILSDEKMGPPTSCNNTISTLPPEVLNPPECTLTNQTSTSATFNCTIAEVEQYVCEATTIVVNCEVPEDNNDGECIKWNATGSTDVISTNPTNQFDIEVTDMSEFTNYTCHGVLQSGDILSEDGNQVNVTTYQGEPGPVQNLICGNATANSVSATWEPPENGTCIELYEVALIGSNNDSIRTNDTNYTFFGLTSCTVFNISVRAILSDEKMGPPTSCNNTISTLPPEVLNPPECTLTNQTSTSATFNCTIAEVEQYVCEATTIVVNCEAPEDNNNGEWIIWNATGSTNVTSTNPTNQFDIEVTDMSEFTNYTCHGVLQSGDIFSEYGDQVNFTTNQGVPDPPEFKTITVTNKSLHIIWLEPRITKGVITNYKLKILPQEPQYFTPEDCPDRPREKEKQFDSFTTEYEFPNASPSFKYNISIKASTCAGYGEDNSTDATTSPGEPEKIRDLSITIDNNTDENYDAHVTYSFKYPCNANGESEYINVRLVGKRFNKPDIQNDTLLTQLEPSYSGNFLLRPEYNYSLSVYLYNKEYYSKDTISFNSPSGVPPKATESINTSLHHDSSQMSFTLSCNLFSEDDGVIKYYAIILGEKNYEEKSTHGFWDGTESSWPEIDKESNDTNHLAPYQATEKFWNPFTKNECNYSFILGDTNNSEFNKPLESNVVYMLKVRGFTSSGYRDTDMIELPPLVVPTKLGMILGISFGIFGTLLLLGFIYMLRKKRMQWKMKKELIKSDFSAVPTPIPVKNFIKHYNELESNNEKLKQEFILLTKKSAEVILPGYDGLLPENKKKNRYTNVLPYDERRVKLLNDDNPISNYINASYILGYSEINEYIATQGPLENTCGDFWTMVMQENVSLIVMVAQFVEQNKNKCFKYFPENHDIIMELENDISIKCITELNFKTLIIRTLLVQKDLEQWTVTHLQYVEWPDFGCPQDTDVILEICQTMRDSVKKISSPIVVHGSAGVGRTGTLIALVIILEAMKLKQKVDVFNTVLNLRKYRKNMVETEKQYLFIHTCIKATLENPKKTSVPSLEEPLYETID